MVPRTEPPMLCPKEKAAVKEMAKMRMHFFMRVGLLGSSIASGLLHWIFAQVALTMTRRLGDAVRSGCGAATGSSRISGIVCRFIV